MEEDVEEEEEEEDAEEEGEDGGVEVVDGSRRGEEVDVKGRGKEKKSLAN